MAVVINELEQLPPPSEPAGPSPRGTGEAGAAQPPAPLRPAKLMAMIRREASRSARLWAD